LSPASVAPRHAELRVRGSKVELVPAVRGRMLDFAATALRLAESDGRSVHRVAFNGWEEP
jgi:hypothetical protein